MMGERLIIFGSAGHAKVIIDAIEKEQRHAIIGLIDSFRSIGAETLGYKILGHEKDIGSIAQRHNISGCVIAVGDNWQRSQISARIRSGNPSLKFVNIIHPETTIGRDVALGCGNVILAGSIINSCCEIGDFCIVNTGAILEHDSTLGDYSSLAPGAVTGGNVHLGNYAVLSLGAKVIHNCRIGDHSVIGAGAVVVRDVPSHVVAFGVPAKIIRKRQPGDKYL